MKKIRAYHILEANTLDGLQILVRDSIANDYVLAGGVSVVVSRNGGYDFFQAVVLFEN